MRTMHQWRKRVKDLRYAAEALRRAEPDRGLPRPLPRLPGKRRKRISSEARWMRRLAGRADELGELLGEEHDLALFGAWLAEHGRQAGAGRATRRRLRKQIVRRRRKLRRRALRDSRRLYARKPRALVRRVARAYEAGAALADAQHRQRARAARQRHGGPIALAPTEQRCGHRRFDGQPALARSGVV